MYLTLFTNNPVLALQADQAGVDRIGPDLEYIGKAQRQQFLNTWISDHKMSEIPAIRAVLKNAKLFVRTNPMNPGLKQEINQLIDMGVKALMLPYFHRTEEAAEFIHLVAGRADVSLLVETAASAIRLPEIVKLDGIHDIHIGLNDLHLSLKLTSHFELLVSPFMKYLTDILQKSGHFFGFGGIARYTDSRLPIDSDLVYSTYAFHRAHSALLSRVFTSSVNQEVDLKEEVSIARCRLVHWFGCDQQMLDAAQHELRDSVYARMRQSTGIG